MYRSQSQCLCGLQGCAIDPIYYNKKREPFRTITELPYEEAYKLLKERQHKDPKSTNPNVEWFLKERYRMEKIIRNAFITKGGNPIRKAPIYMTLGENIYMETWYDNLAIIKIDINKIDLRTVSFTYGDSFPVFNPDLDKGEEFRNTVYMYDEIVKIIEKYGFPENVAYNMKEWIFPKEKPINHYLKYVEAHVWSDDVKNLIIE